MSDQKRLRKHLFVDPKIQGALIVRVLLYWVLCLFSMVFTLLCWRLLTGPARLVNGQFDELWLYYEPVLIVSCVLLPLAILDIVRFSNRFVGPLLRLRRAMRELARGQHVEPIKFRGNDFWQEFADEFNALRLRVQASDAATTAERDEPETIAAG